MVEREYTALARPSVLVTGHLGFIGPHVWMALKQKGYARVIGMDLKKGPEHGDQNICTADLPDVDWCIHLAAQTDARANDALGDARTNILGSIRLFEKYKERCIFASSCAVNYPTTPYAISKLAGEHYARMYGSKIVRLCNIYGPGGHGVVDIFRRTKGKYLNIAGDGSQLRTYQDVGVVVAAFLHMMDTGNKFHILQGDNMSVLDVAHKYGPPGVKFKFVERNPNDILDGRQKYWD